MRWWLGLVLWIWADAVSAQVYNQPFEQNPSNPPWTRYEPRYDGVPGPTWGLGRVTPVWTPNPPVPLIGVPQTPGMYFGVVDRGAGTVFEMRACNGPSFADCSPWSNAKTLPTLATPPSVTATQTQSDTPTGTPTVSDTPTTTATSTLTATRTFAASPTPAHNPPAAPRLFDPVPR